MYTFGFIVGSSIPKSLKCIAQLRRRLRQTTHRKGLGLRVSDVGVECVIRDIPDACGIAAGRWTSRIPSVRIDDHQILDARRLSPSTRNPIDYAT